MRPKTRQDMNQSMRQYIESVIESDQVPAFDEQSLNMSKELFDHFRKIKIIDKESLYVRN